MGRACAYAFTLFLPAILVHPSNGEEGTAATGHLPTPCAPLLEEEGREFCDWTSSFVCVVSSLSQIKSLPDPVVAFVDIRRKYGYVYA